MLVNVSNRPNVLLCFAEVKVSEVLMLLGPTVDFINYGDNFLLHAHV